MGYTGVEILWAPRGLAERAGGGADGTEGTIWPNLSALHQDFTFETSDENAVGAAAVDPDLRNQPPVDQGATGASQGLLDRKEVLGGECSPSGLATSGAALAVGCPAELTSRSALLQGSLPEVWWGSSSPCAWWASCCTA